MPKKRGGNIEILLLVLFSILALTSLISATTTITDISINSTSANLNGNLTLGQKITFTLGEIIDNIVDGWIRITGGLNVTKNFLAGNNVLFVNSTSGNIGIGTSSPITQIYIPVKAPSNYTGIINVTGIYPRQIRVQGRYAYIVTSSSGTLEIYDVSNPSSPLFISSIAVGSNSQHFYISGRYAYVAGGDALRIVDISNPKNPQVVGSMSIGTAKSVFVQGSYAYVTDNDNNILYVISISDPTSPVIIGSTNTEGVDAAQVYVQGRYAYIPNKASDNLTIFDVSNPSDPTLVGNISTGDNTDPRSIFVQGSYAYVALETPGLLQIINITDPTAPTIVSNISVGTAPQYVYVQGRYAYVVNELSEDVKIIDISNPSSPSSAGSVSTEVSPRYCYVQGRYLYVTNKLSNTLQIFDMGGAYIQHLEAGSFESGDGTFKNSLTVNNGLDVKGGIIIGNGGLSSAGDVGFANKLSVIGNVGIGTTNSSNLLTINGTGMMQLKANTTVLICNSTNAGAIYYDGTLNKHRGCNSTNWNDLY